MDNNDNKKTSLIPLIYFINISFLILSFFIINLILYSNDSSLVTNHKDISLVPYMLALINTVYFFILEYKNKHRLESNSFYKSISQFYKFFLVIFSIGSFYLLYFILIYFFVIAFFYIVLNIFLRNKKLLYYFLIICLSVAQTCILIVTVFSPTKHELDTAYKFSYSFSSKNP